MSQHKDNDPIELEMALRINNLPVNSPSVLADAFRNGWYFNAEKYSISTLQKQLNDIESLNLSQKGR